MTAAVVSLPGLHPGQAEVEGWFEEKVARFVMLMCGRRWGKTKYGVRRASVVALRGGKVGWFAPTYKYASEAWRELVKRLGPAVVQKNEQERRLELVGGGVVEVWTMDTDDPARGRDYDLAVVDEAGLVPELRAVWFEAIRPTLVDRRGQALFLGTPKGRSGSFSRMYAEAERGEEGWRARRAPTIENPWIPADEVEAARRELPAEAFAQEFEGVPTDDGGNPFGLKAIADGARDKLASGPVVVYGLDLARATDHTVLVGLNAQCEVCVLERWQAPWAVTRERVRQMVGRVPVVADATGVGDPIVADLQMMGVMATAFRFTMASKMALVQRLITAIQTRFITYPDGWLVRELESFGFTYTQSGVRYEAADGDHDDGVMALGLAVFGWDRVQGSKPALLAMGPRFRPADDPDGMTGWQEEDRGQLPSGFA